MIDFPANPSIDDEYVVGNVFYIWTGEAWDLKDSVSDKVNRSGDSMNGPLLLFRVPIEPNEAVAKNYVDTHPIDGGVF